MASRAPAGGSVGFRTCPTLLAAVAIAVSVSSARAETLAEAIALAYRENPTLQAGRYDVRAADEAVVQAKAELRTNAAVSISGATNRFWSGDAAAAADPARSQLYTTSNGQGQITVTQPLYTGGRATADRSAAEAGVRAGRETLRGIEGDVLLGVVTAYVDVRRYERALRVWETSVTELERLVKEIEARQIAGELTLTDVAQAHAQIAIARQQVELTGQGLAGARADYAALVGRDPGQLADEPDLPRVPPTIDAAFDLAVRLNPELARARFAEEESRQGIAVARSQGRPTVTLRGNAAVSGNADPWRLSREDRGYSGSVVFAMPLSAGGRIASQVRQAEDRNDADRLRVEEGRRALMRNVVNAWNQMVTSERVARLLDEQRHAALIQLEGMISEYRVGLRSTFDVLYAQQSLRDAEVSALQSGRDRYVAEATLLRRSGLLEVHTLMTGVALHDPSDHVRAILDKDALPWDGLVALLDRAGRPPARSAPVRRPPASPAPAMIGATAPPPAAGRSLALRSAGRRAEVALPGARPADRRRPRR